MEGQGGPRTFHEIWESPENDFLVGVGGKALPKGLQGTIQSIPLSQIPLKPHGGPFPPQNHVFQIPVFVQKRSPAQPEPNSRS